MRICSFYHCNWDIPLRLILVRKRGNALTHWLIYSHVGSLFKFWLCGYCIFAIVTRLAGPLANSRQEERECFGFRLAQFREQWHIIRMRTVRSTNYPSKRIPHGAHCVRKPAGVFWSRLGLRKCSNRKLTKNCRNRNECCAST